jgi:23S rRNA pseudouridine2605 synthase
MSMERVQKILAQAGIASRRKAEELIIEGAVTINGRVAKLGDKADFSKDAIKVRDKLLQRIEPHVYVAFHKPKGVISMFADPQRRPTLADYLGKIRANLFPMGRLDFNSEGLLLLTNDGALAEKIQRHEQILRVYHIKVKGHPDADTLARLRRGMRTEGRMIKPYSVSMIDQYAKKSKIQIVFEGRGNIDIRSFLEKKGLLSERSIRVAIGHLKLKDLAPGRYIFLKKSQVEALIYQPELGLREFEANEPEKIFKVKVPRSKPEPRRMGIPSAGDARIRFPNARSRRGFST